MNGVAPADGRVKTVDLEGIATALPYRLAPLYLLARGEEPTRAALPVPAPLTELSEGPHLSYAIQWFSFAAVALVGCAVLLRRGGAHAEGRTE
jgi:surfeit locus 1 family protein